MKRMKFFLLAALVFSLCISLCGCKSQPRQPEEIIRQMVTAYGKSTNHAQDKTEDYLKELYTVAPYSAQTWRSIMGYWDYANNAMPIHYDTLPDDLPQDQTLCLVVLGYQLNTDGSIRDELEGRLQTALACATQYPNAYILCTGGGTASGNKSATEAGQMAAWLKTHGVDAARILVEDQSLSTVENAEFSFGLLNEECPEVNSVAIISSDYHIAWGAVLFQTRFLLEPDHSISVISNAAYKADNHENYNIIRYQTSGILELAKVR